MSGDGRTAARLRVYRLMEALQGDHRADARVSLQEVGAEAAEAGWSDVVYLARLGQAMDGVLQGTNPARTLRQLDELIAGGDEPQFAALVAHALGLRAIMRATTGDTDLVLADAARGLALLERGDQSPMDACTALVVCAAAYNALSLWELVEAIYDRAAALEPFCEEPIQAAAIAMNRVVIRLEWASALLEQGDDEAARQVLTRAAADARAAEQIDGLPDLWRTGAVAARAALQLFLDPPDRPDDLVEQTRAAVAELRAGGDRELLPLAETLTALALLRIDRAAEALGWLVPDTDGSRSSGARSFRLWVHAQVLLAQGPVTAAATAYREYADILAGQRRDARRAVLAAARSRIGGESTLAERDRLAIDIVLDPLTGLANRRAFDAWLDQERSEPRLTAVILVDLDNFKVINDLHGHATGDEVLRQVGAILLRHVRPGDMAIRVGGDEFALILEAEPPARAPSEAVFTAIATTRASELRDAIANGDWPKTPDRATFSASAGVAVRLLGAFDPAAAAELYHAADLALYAAKVPRQRTRSASFGAGGS